MNAKRAKYFNYYNLFFKYNLLIFTIIDIQLFIVGIEKHECSWNATNKLFMDRDSKRKAQNDISMVIFKDWESPSIQERVAHSKFISLV